VIADSCFIIDSIRGEKRAAALMRELHAKRTVLAVPTPVLFALWEGIERSDRPQEELQHVEEGLQSCIILPFDTRHAQRAGRLSGEIVRRGLMMDPLDAQIAAVALSEAMPVVTRNRKDFERVPGLKVVGY
jgi:tRNA(fMet)-specific endonuclease VapC